MCVILEGESFATFLVVKVVAQRIFSEYLASYSNEAKDKWIKWTVTASPGVWDTAQLDYHRKKQHTHTQIV